MLKFTQNAAASAAEMEDEILAIEINDIATIIKARTKNQFLAITERPIIASGDVETVLVHFEFDSAWAAFDVKFACFYKANQPHIVYKMLISDDGYATVPPEVLDDAGNIFFGVKGYISDLPQIRKTSLNVMYEVRSGTAQSGGYVPTPDEFAQMMSSVAEIKKDVSEKLAAIDRMLNDMVEGALDGKSAYEIALEEGFKGTKAEWLASLRGEKGDKGEKGADGVTPDLSPVLAQIAALEARVAKLEQGGGTDLPQLDAPVIEVEKSGYTLIIDQNGNYDAIKVYINGVEQSVSYGTWTDVETVGVEDINGDGEMLIDESGDVWLPSVYNETVTVTMTEDVHIVDIYH